jgi:hypothetical protein
MQNLWYLFGAKPYFTWTLHSHGHKICINEKRENFIKINTLAILNTAELLDFMGRGLAVLNPYKSGVFVILQKSMSQPFLV